MNEREIRQGLGGGRKALCSLTGRPCVCLAGGGCQARAKSVDGPPIEALRWARTAQLRLIDAAEALDLAVDYLMFDRPLPAPEWRDKKRRINALIKELEEECK